MSAHHKNRPANAGSVGFSMSAKIVPSTDRRSSWKSLLVPSNPGRDWPSQYLSHPMKTLRNLAAAFLAASVLTVAAFAADLTGNWKWTAQGRNGPMETTAQLTLSKEGALSGTVAGRNGDTPISDASFKDGTIAFAVKREFNGNTFVIKYEGKLEGDTITGTIERPGRDGGAPTKAEWKATRVK